MSDNHLFNFEVIDGHAVFQIKGDGFGDYFFTARPVATTWFDCRGSVGKYLCSSKYDPAIQQSIQDELVGLLNSGSVMELDDLEKAITPFLQVFVSGKYAVRIINGDLGQVARSAMEYSPRQIFDYPYFAWAREAKPELEEEYREEALKRYKEDNRGDFLMYTCTSNFYDAMEFSLIATLPAEEIDQARVDHYKKLIQAGKRPYALVHNCFFVQEEVFSNSYVIDGHHKLLAYQELNIWPYLIEITQTSSEEDTAFDIMDLTSELLPWQIKHIFEKKYASNKALIAEILKTPSHPLRQFVHHGNIREVYIDGSLHYEGYYENHEAIGEVTRYFPNGQKMRVDLHRGGKYAITKQSWFKTGELSTTFIGDLETISGKICSYYQNGKINTVTFYENGYYKDGRSSISYDQDGRIIYEAFYEKGTRVKARHFNPAGDVTQEWPKKS